MLELEDCVRRCARHDRTKLMALAGATLGLAALALLAPARSDDSPTSRWILFGVLAACALVVGDTALKAPGRVEVGLGILARRPGDAVWCYVWQNQYDTRLILGLVDGTTTRMRVPRKRADELLLAAAARLPHAVIGYSPEARATFERDPRALRGGAS